MKFIDLSSENESGCHVYDYDTDDDEQSTSHVTYCSEDR
jgi:hypothetical protein